MSSSAEPRSDRKLLKPLLEKRRRERMNRSLERLRLLLLAATGDQRLRNPKVEKAQILQKTLQFLRAQPHPDPQGTAELFLRRYRSGYRECLARAARFLQALPAQPPAPRPEAFCPSPLAGTGGAHGPPTAQPGPGCSQCHRCGPASHGCQLMSGPSPGPAGGPEHGFGSAPGDGPREGLRDSPSDSLTCPSNGLACCGCTEFGPSQGPGLRPTFGPAQESTSGPGLWPTSGPSQELTSGPVLRPTLGPVQELISSPGLRPTSGPSQEFTSGLGLKPTSGPSQEPTLGPGLRPTSGPSRGPTFGPSWEPSLGPQYGHEGSPRGQEDSQQHCCTKQEAPGEAQGLPGPLHHVWRPWP